MMKGLSGEIAGSPFFCMNEEMFLEWLLSSPGSYGFYHIKNLFHFT